MRMCNSIDSLEGRRENDGHILKKKKIVSSRRVDCWNFSTS